MKKLLVPLEAKGTRFDLYLKEMFPDRSRSEMQRAIERGEILLDDKQVTSHYFLHGGEKVRFVKPAVSKVEAPEIPSLTVVAEEKDFLVVEKPAGMAVHPGAGVKPPTLVDALLPRYPKLRGLGAPDRPGIVHRLDKDVSGLLIVGRTEKGVSYFQELFRTRGIVKRYVALVHGEMPKDDGTITLPIARSTRRARMAARPPGAEGKDATTHWRVLERFEKKATLLSVQIETGRTHQIRAHFFALGHPIVGDPLYRQARLRLRGAPPRPFLHAAELVFVDPEGKERTYRSEIPKELGDYLQSLKPDRKSEMKNSKF